MSDRTVFVLEANPRHATRVEACIGKLGLTAKVLKTAGSFFEAVTTASVGAGMWGLVVDYGALFEPRQKQLAELTRLAAGAPVLLVLEGGSLSLATKAGQLGVADTLCKPADVLALQKAFRPGRTQEIVVKPMSLTEIQEEHIRSSLERNGNNISATARQLGVSRSTLQRKLKRHAR